MRRTQERPSNGVSNNHHRQQWTPVDADGRWSPGQTRRAAGSWHRDLASGRRGRRSGLRSSSRHNPRLSAALPNSAVFDQGGAYGAADPAPALRSASKGPRSARRAPSRDLQIRTAYSPHRAGCVLRAVLSRPGPARGCRARRSSGENLSAQHMAKGSCASRNSATWPRTGLIPCRNAANMVPSDKTTAGEKGQLLPGRLRLPLVSATQRRATPGDLIRWRFRLRSSARSRSCCL
jgi:hypothetical protein